MLSPLFIQLFGRDAIDRLGQSGFDSADVLARTSPEQVSEEAGIPVALARRIVALAVESGEPVPAEDVGATAEADPGWSAMLPDGLHAGAAAGAAAGPQAAPGVAPAPPEAETPAETASGGPPAAFGEAPDGGDAFVDEAGLVSWMGFAARGAGRDSRAWSVNDSILDRPAEGPADGVPSDEVLATSASAAGGTPAPADRSAPARSPRLLPDSLWSFGRFEDRETHGAAGREKEHDDRRRAAAHGDPSADTESSARRDVRPRNRSHPRRRKRDA